MQFEQRIVLDEGISRQGVHTQLHLQDSEVVVQKTYDAEPYVEHAAAMRAATRGERWGEMRKIATIPPAEYARFLLIRDNEERKKAVRRWLQENPAFVTFERALIVPQAA